MPYISKTAHREPCEMKCITEMQQANRQRGSQALSGLSVHGTWATLEISTSGLLIVMI
jgi:hypothetical protein